MQLRRLLAAALGVLLVLTSGSAHAASRTWNYLTTGNGHGFQVFDATGDKYKIVQFLDHPYRYTKPTPGQPTAEGIARRNLAYDFFFGIKGADWLNHATNDSPEYLEQDNIIHAPCAGGGATADCYFFSPFGLERNVMVGLLHAPGKTDAAALFNFHMGTQNGTEAGTDGEVTKAGATPGVIIETGNGQGAMVYVALTPLDAADCQGPFGKIAGGLANNPACNGNDIAVGFQGKLQNEWFAVAIGYTDDPNGANALAGEIKTWAANRAPDKILADVKADWEAWRKPPPAGTSLCSDDEKKLWRMSETVLRMGQVREPNIPGRNNNGMVLASLPVGEWHTGWVRDAQYAVVALARMGHVEEAKKAMEFFLLNATPTGKYKSYLRTPVDYKISVVRYFGTGEEEADFNQDGPNIELDGWGLVMWSTRQVVEAANDPAWANKVYATLKDLVASPLEANLESNGIVTADSSIWEVHNAKNRHYAYTTLTAARGFCDMAQIANKSGHPGDVGKYQGLATKVKTGFFAAFPDPQGALAGSLEGLQQGKYYDGAVAEAFTWNILTDWTGDTAKATLAMLGKLKVQSGGFKRNDDGLSSYDNNEWILVDLRIANALRRAGRGAEGDSIVANIVSKAAANFYLIPELYDDTGSNIGSYTGSIPMVGYGGGAYVVTMLDRSGLIEPNDCADGKGATLPKVDCSGVSTTPGTGGPGDADGGTGNNADGVPDATKIPFVDACLCRMGPDRGLPPIALAFFLAFPVVTLIRRRSRR
jgi:GH15 family glucan-1,4-alpha-glucosidase